MSLKEQIDQDIKKAMLSKSKDDLRALRAIKSMILLAETEKGAAGALSQESEMQLLQKAVKQRKDSIEIYVEQGRKDLAEIEEAEVAIIERYLPEPMDEETLLKVLQEIIDEAGATSMKDIGRVMGIATKKLAGKANNKVISDKVRILLS
jgi:uncharacterized protein YqeY